MVKNVSIHNVGRNDIIIFKNIHGETEIDQVTTRQGEMLVTDRGNVIYINSVSNDHVTGKAYFQLPLIGYAANFSKSDLGLLLFLGLPGLYLIGTQLRKLFCLLGEENVDGITEQG